MLTVSFTADTVIFKLTGWAMFWALKSRLTIPRRAIIAARRWSDDPVQPAPLRFPGTHLPGIITAGTYVWKGRREFWSVRHRERAIVLDLEACPYTRLVLEVPEPDALLAQLQPIPR